jgi:hypothetical protein
MLLGFKSRWTTPAEWTYFRPRFESQPSTYIPGFATHQDLVEEVLDELLLQRSGGEQAVEISSEQLRDEVAVSISSQFDMVKAYQRTCPPGGR